MVSNYAIPEEQQRVDQILQNARNALDKLVRDVGTATEDRHSDGIEQ